MPWKVSEGAFQRWVTDCADRTGWRWWHVPMPVRPVGQGKFVPEPRAKGLSDLLLIHRGDARMIFAEIKGDAGRLSDEQREFLQLVEAVAARSRDPLEPDGRGHRGRTVAAYVWHPGLEPQIEQILKCRILV